MQAMGLEGQVLVKYFQRLMGGFGVTIGIGLVSVSMACLLGIPFGLLMTRKNRILRAVCLLWLETVRIVPLLVWLFLCYFGLSKATGIHISGQAAAILVFTLWGMAEMGDIVRGAVTSMPRHQYESAYALGMTALQCYCIIILPQAIRRILPGAMNLATRMIKTTALIPLIGVVEVIKVGQQIIETASLKTPTAPLWVYGVIFLLYFMICMPVSALSRQLERQWAEA